MFEIINKYFGTNGKGRLEEAKNDGSIVASGCPLSLPVIFESLKPGCSILILQPNSLFIFIRNVIQIFEDLSS